MADLGKNSLWTDISNKSSNVETNIIGPDYSYANNISGPAALGIGSNGTFSQLVSNAEGIAYYVEQLITGNPPLGNQFFINTGGTCTATDGSIQSRSNYINNMSSGAAALPPAMSELGSDFNGLIPGVVDDIEGLNPLHLFNSMMADASPACSCYQCPTTSGRTYGFLSPDLTTDLATSQCQVVDMDNCVTTGVENFSNYESSTLGAIPTLLAGLGFLYFIFSGK